MTSPPKRRGRFSGIMKSGKKDATPKSEAWVQKRTLEWLAMAGIFAWRNNTGVLRDHVDRPVHFGHIGSADIIGVAPDGSFLAIECKSDKGILSDHQEIFQRKVLRNQGTYLVVKPKNFPDILERWAGGIEFPLGAPVFDDLRRRLNIT